MAVPAGGHTAQPQPAIAADEVAEAVRAAMRGSAYQTELPGADAAAIDDPTPRWEPELVDPQRHGSGSWRSQSALDEIARVALWILAAVVLIVLCFWLTGLVPNRRARLADGGKAAPDVTADHVRRAGPPDILAEADRLAARGDYDGAIHCLLLAALERLRKGLDLPIAASLTCREVVDLTNPAAGVQAALRTLVMSVEISRFGGRAADAGVYGSCRDSFRQVSAAMGSAA